VLSLLLYAQSNDIWVPNFAVSELYQGIFGDASRHLPQFPQAQSAQAPLQSHPGQTHSGGSREATPSRAPHAHAPLSVVPAANHERASEAYAIGHLRERLAEDPRTNELDIEIEQSQDRVLLRGEVSVAERRQTVEKIARECFPSYKIENQIRVIHFNEPSEAEEIE
jgi:osmotically-inducible protein OsmY